MINKMNPLVCTLQLLISIREKVHIAVMYYDIHKHNNTIMLFKKPNMHNYIKRKCQTNISLFGDHNVPLCNEIDMSSRTMVTGKIVHTLHPTYTMFLMSGTAWHGPYLKNTICFYNLK